MANFTRREFVYTGCSAVAASTLRVPRMAAAKNGGTSNNGSAAGKVQTGLAAMFATIDYPFIDVMRIAGSTWQSFLTPTSDPYALLNSDGYPKAFAAGTSQWRVLLSGLLQNPSDGFGGNWVLDWIGGPATLNATFSGMGVLRTPVLSNITETGGRIVYRVTSTSSRPFSPIGAQVNITAISGQITRVRLYPARCEKLLDSGQQWDPTFLEFYKVWGRIRFMDWSATNSNIQIKWAHRTLPTQFSQRGFNINRQFYCGQCAQTKGDFKTANALPTNPTSWAHGQMVQAYVVTPPKRYAVQSFTLGATTTVNAPGHPFVTGDSVQFGNNAGGGSGPLSTAKMTGQGAPVFTVSSVVPGVSFDLGGVDSSRWNGTGGGGVYYAIRFSTGLLPFKPIAGMDGSALFSNVIAANQPVTLVYDADFDRLLYTAAPNGAGTGAPSGAAIETLVDLANHLGPTVQPWFNIPHSADDDYVRNWASYIRDNLNPAIRFCVECSNEVWNPNTGFIQTQNYQNKGALKWHVDQSTESMYQYYGFRFREMMRVIGAVFSGQLSRVNRVFAQRTTDTPGKLINSRMQCALGGFASGDFPISYADSICIAPYYNPDRSKGLPVENIWNVLYSNDPTLIASGLAYLDSRMRGDTTGQGSLVYYSGVTEPPFKNSSGQFASWARIAATYGLKLTAYEGGWNIFPSTWDMVPRDGSYVPPSTGISVTLTKADIFSYFAAYASSPLYARFLTDATSAFFAVGGEFPAQYCVTNGAWSGGNMFGLKQPNRLAPDIPSYRAWRQLNGR